VLLRAEPNGQRDAEPIQGLMRQDVGGRRCGTVGYNEVAGNDHLAKFQLCDLSFWLSLSRDNLRQRGLTIIRLHLAIYFRGEAVKRLHGEDPAELSGI
jgi:hypothetical protein